MHALLDSPFLALSFYHLPSEHIEENFIYLAKKYWDQVQNFVPFHLTGGLLRVEWLRDWPFKWLIFPFQQ